MIQIVEPNHISMLWMFPQIFLDAIGTVLFNYIFIFCYMHSPVGLCLSVFCLRNFYSAVSYALDMMLDVIDGTKMTTKYTIYTILMTMSVCYYLYLSMKYTYISDANLFEEDHDLKDDNASFVLFNAENSKGVTIVENDFYI